MNVTLRKEDRRAVDLLLDRSVKAAKGHAVYASADPTLGERISHAHRLLRLLDLLPDGDPPTDLVSKTVRYVEASSGQPAGIRPQFPMLGNLQQRPHA